MVPLCVISAMLVSILVFAATIPNTFNTGGVISATKFNDNFSYIASRLWELSGSDLSYTAGKVGIGTASPGAKLEVKGGLKVTCAAGFTSVETTLGGGLMQLGCIQNTEQGSATCQSAILDCFDTYGGKLPSYAQIYIAFQRFNLTDESDDPEWVDSAFTAPTYFNGCGLIDTAGGTFGQPDSSLNTYRCWIPK